MFDIYVIKEGDTIESIAKKFNTTLQVIYDLNIFRPISMIEVGKSIVVPNSDIQAFEYYTVKKGDTIYSIAERYNTTPEIFISLNGLKEGEYIYENEILLVPKQDVNIYLTKENDTLKQVVKKLDGNIDDIYMQNPNIYLLPGQLVIYKN